MCRGRGLDRLERPSLFLERIPFILDLGQRVGLEVVEQILKRFNPVPIAGLPRFTGGAVGFIGYEFIHDVEPIVPRPKKDDLGTPTMYFLIADELLIFDRVAQTITVLVNAVLDVMAREARPEAFA